MDLSFDLAVADVRLLKTWHLLRRVSDAHPDKPQLGNAVDAIHAARAIVKDLRARTNARPGCA